VDRAGNREELRWRDIRIDLEPPHVEASAAYDNGMGELTIAAGDPLSGVAFVEYTINGGEAERYVEPLLFMEPGMYLVRYRAVDRAGNVGPWQGSDVGISPNPAALSLIESPKINGLDRPAMGHARNGMPLKAAAGAAIGGAQINRSDPAAMGNLPSYTLGAEYILWEEGDALFGEGSRISFRVKRNAVIYLFLPRTAAATGDALREALTAWSLVEDRADINRRSYPGGATVYMRRYRAFGVVELPGTPGGVAQPLIMAQERGSISADILIRHEPAAGTKTDGNTITDAGPEEDAGLGTRDAFILDTLVRPWQYARRLPLLKRWFVNIGEGWVPLDGNRYDPPANAGEEPVSAPLRFRVELYTPDGELEYRAEKTYDK
jgi:hypothetical protein